VLPTCWWVPIKILYRFYSLRTAYMNFACIEVDMWETTAGDRDPWQLAVHLWNKAEERFGTTVKPVNSANCPLKWGHLWIIDTFGSSQWCSYFTGFTVTNWPPV
jgi:hypothetical protein